MAGEVNQMTAIATGATTILQPTISDGSRVEEIALSLRAHQTTVPNWRYTGLARELHRWVELFDIEFKLDLPSYPVLKFAPLRNAYATYGCLRGELGTRDNITFNISALERDPALILRTLCHELLHLWQHYHGTPSRSKYHNKEFRDKASECGLIVDPKGCTNGHTEVFTETLARYGIHLEPLVEPLAIEVRLYGSGKREQKLKKYSCGCTNVRCAVDLRATCNKCGQPFGRV